jgi:cold shock protein
MINGTVKFFDEDKGYGFLKPDGSHYDVYVHVTELKKTGLSVLTTGEKVLFDQVPSTKKQGGFTAINVKKA